jgi:hypothetical protein
MSGEFTLLYRADAYRDPWNGAHHPGKVHAFDREAEKTYCGKQERFCPGKRIYGTVSLVDCLKCKESIESRERRAQWEREAPQRQAEREEEERQWWRAYNAYLLTPTWLAKRRQVLKRANDICEACRKEVAVQAHHLQYPPRGVLPGSPEWIRFEKCHHLIAVCRQCHDDLHELKDLLMGKIPRPLVDSL